MVSFYQARAQILQKDKPKILRVDINLCVGCRACVMACSLVKEGVFSNEKSRIQVYEDESRCLGIPNICEHCIDPPCIPICPVSAITKDDVSGIVKINEETCTGCGSCQDVCPFDSIRIRDLIAIKCDLCNGSPKCVEVCHPYALQYIEKQPATIKNKNKLAEERSQALAALKKSHISEK